MFFAGNPIEGTTLSGQITVVRPGQETYPIQVTLGDIVATYEPDDIGECNIVLYCKRTLKCKEHV